MEMMMTGVVVVAEAFGKFPWTAPPSSFSFLYGHVYLNNSLSFFLFRPDLPLVVPT
jgi:hypothetical protein